MLHLKKTQNKLSSILIVNLMILSTNFEAERTWIKSPRKLKKGEEKKEKEEILMLYIE